MIMDKSMLLSELENIENLPTLPIVVQQIQKLIASPNSNMIQIASIIARDQAIAARVIRLINSAFYGLNGKVSSIQQAIVLLGLNTVKNLVVGVSVIKTFAGIPGAASFFDREKFWMHTFSCALGARMIAKELGQNEVEDFFLAGLLHDIGILVFDQFFHQAFIAAVQKSVRGQIDFTIVEREILGATHGDVGDFIARKWKIPLSIVHAIHYHHQPGVTDRECEASLLVISVVHAADIASYNRGVDPGFKTGQNIYYEPALKRIGFTAARLDEMFKTVEKEVKSVAAEWGVLGHL
jgi:HD-like signal output (HDOD) protein